MISPLRGDWPLALRCWARRKHPWSRILQITPRVARIFRENGLMPAAGTKRSRKIVDVAPRIGAGHSMLCPYRTVPRCTKVLRKFGRQVRVLTFARSERCARLAGRSRSKILLLTDCRSVELRALCNDSPQTPPGPEGSNGSGSVSCAAEYPKFLLSPARTTVPPDTPL